MKNYSFKLAEPEAFATYESIYGADIEMYYDWAHRLRETMKRTDERWFLYENDDIIGGAVISEGHILYAFKVPAFKNRERFWQLLIEKAKADAVVNEVWFWGMSEADRDVLVSFGAESGGGTQMLIRPTAALTFELPDGFSIETVRESGLEELVEVQKRALAGTVLLENCADDYEDMFGKASAAFESAKATGTLECFVVARNPDNEIIGACHSGIFPHFPQPWTWVDDFYILPDYRGQGIGKALLRASISRAAKFAPVYTLSCLLDNPARNLYLRMGFMLGPKHFNLVLKD